MNLLATLLKKRLRKWKLTVWLEKMSSNATLVALEGLVLRLGLLSPKCFESLIGNLNYGDSDCLKMLISKGLGLAIIAGATCVKLPQIFKITKYLFMTSKNETTNSPIHQFYELKVLQNVSKMKKQGLE